MKVLIMMLFNTSTSTYHPIMYFEHPFFADTDLVRFKSKGHRTNGFVDRDMALATIQPELVDRLGGYSIYKDLDDNLIWDGEDIPADIQLRNNSWIDNYKE